MIEYVEFWSRMLILNARTQEKMCWTKNVYRCSIAIFIAVPWQ